MVSFARSTLLALSLLLTLSACGSSSSSDDDSDDDDTGGTAEGLWQGTTSTGRAQTVLVLDDGTLWAIFSAQGNSAVTAGFSQANGTSDSGSFSGSNALIFNFEGLGFGESFSLAGTYEAMSSFDFTAIFALGFTVTSTHSYDPQYDITPDLASIAGTYSGQARNLGSDELTTVTVSDTGAITGDFTGCTFTGSASPRANGNVYNISYTFDGGDCLGLTGTTVTGVAYFDAATMELTSVTLNSDRSNGFVYTGTKP